MSSLKESGKTTESIPCSKPRPRMNARSKRSAGEIKNVQLPETKEDNQEAGEQAKYPMWFTLVMMSLALGYGMYQHDTLVLFGVLVLVNGSGQGYAIKAVIKLLETWRTR